MKKIIILFGATLSYFAFSQGENNNWYFGNKAGVTFNTTPPTALTDSEMNTLEAVSTISDSNGNLLFYTNGQTIRNRQHLTMTNGSGLYGYPTTHQTIILPKPGSSTLYYVFTMGFANGTTNPIAYSVVDMNLGLIGVNGQPLGAVSNIKNEEIFNEYGLPFGHVSEAVTAVEHSDNESYWILIPNGEQLYSFKLDNEGFHNDNPVTSNLNFSDIFENYGHIRISPKLPAELNLDYTHFVSFTRWNTYLLEFDLYVRGFNNSTGVLSNLYSLNAVGDENYSTEFNSDGTLLYAARQKDHKVIVLDLFTSTPTNMTRVVYNGVLHERGGSLQRAIDDNIYYSINDTQYLAKIENSNSFDFSFIEFESIDLEGELCRYGLPPLIPILNGYNICSDFLTLSSEEDLNFNIYKASNIITTISNYTVTNSQDITLNAGNAIYMFPNTHLENGSIFRATIEGCSSPEYKAKSIINKTNRFIC